MKVEKELEGINRQIEYLAKSMAGGAGPSAPSDSSRLPSLAGAGRWDGSPLPPPISPLDRPPLGPIPSRLTGSVSPSTSSPPSGRQTIISGEVPDGGPDLHVRLAWLVPLFVALFLVGTLVYVPGSPFTAMASLDQAIDLPVHRDFVSSGSVPLALPSSPASLSVSGSASLHASFKVLLDLGNETRVILDVPDAAVPGRANIVRGLVSEERGSFSFVQACSESCALSGAPNSSSLRVRVFNGSVFLDNLTFIPVSSISSSMEPSNHPPRFIGSLLNWTVLSNRSVSIDVAPFFLDDDNDSLTFLATQDARLNITVSGSVVSIRPLGGFIGSGVITVIASDLKDVARANISISVVRAASEMELAVANAPFHVEREVADVLDVEGVARVIVELDLAPIKPDLSAPAAPSVGSSRSNGSAPSDLPLIRQSSRDEARGAVRAARSRFEKALAKTQAGSSPGLLSAAFPSAPSSVLGIVKGLDSLPVLSVRLDGGGLKELLKMPGVKRVSHDRRMGISLAESLPLVNAPAAWNLTVADPVSNATSFVTGAGQSVCVLDTGIDESHPAFAGRLLSGYDFVDDDALPSDDNGHGTHVAGIIASMAPSSSIIPVRVCDGSGQCLSSDVIAGIDFCLNASLSGAINLSVLSGSFGDGGVYNESACPSTIDAALARARGEGVSSVFAAGNDGSSIGVTYPACSPVAIAVGAVDKDGKLASFSNRGPGIDIFAPGVSVNSTIPGGSGLRSGTSMAAPFVSGAVALIWHYGSIGGITASPADVMFSLASGSRNLSGAPMLDSFGAESAFSQASRFPPGQGPNMSWSNGSAPVSFHVLASPVAARMNISPSSLNSTTAAAGSWNFTDDDGDAENGTTWTWFVNGTEAWRDSSLVGYWRFDGGAADSSGLGLHGTLQSSPGNLSNGGVIRGALGFNGTSQFVNLSNQPVRGLSVMSISMWVRPARSVIGMIFENSVSDPSFEDDGGGGALFYVANDGGASFGQLQVGEWNHLVGTINGSVMRAYTNGVLETELNFTLSVSSTADQIFVASRAGNSMFFNGSIDEVKVWNRSLSAAEVSEEYHMMRYGSAEKTGGVAGSPAPDVPAALYRFDESSGSLSRDEFGDTVGEVVGANWTEGRWGTSMLSFDGAADWFNVTDRPALHFGSKMTATFWFRKPSNPAVQPIVMMKNTAGSGTTGFIFYLTTSGSLAFCNPDNCAGFPELDNNTWYHVAAAFDGANTVTYRDGEIMDNQTLVSAFNGEDSDHLYVSCRRGDGECFKGDIEDLAFYNRTLTQQEIQADFSRTFPLFGLNASAFGSNSSLTFQVEPIQADGTAGASSNSSTVTSNPPPPAPPFPYNNNTNATAIRGLDYVRFNNTWNSSAGTTLNASLFSINQTGQWVNMSWQPLQGVSNVSSNVTQITAAGGSKVQWRFYANDSGARQNQTGVFEFTVSNSGPIVSRVNLSPVSLNASISAGGSWNYSDYDSDLENGTTWTWFVNGTPGWSDNSLLRYYRLDGGAVDLAGANHGNISGASNLSVGGLIKGAYDFDGVDDYIEADQLPDVNNLTISFWTYRRNSSGRQFMVFEGDSTAGKDTFVSIEANGDLRFVSKSGASIQKANPPFDRWMHVVAVNNLTEIALYVDGALYASAATTAINHSGSHYALQVGRLADGSTTGNFYNGTIDELKIFNRTLALAEIANEYQMMWYGSTEKFPANGSPAHDIPRAFWRFNEGSGTATTDYFGDLVGTISGAVWNQSGRFGSPALLFDGSTGYVNITNNASLQLSQFTIIIWFKPNMTITDAYSYAPMLLSRNGSNTIGFANNDGRLEVRGPLARPTSTTSQWDVNAWYQVAVTLNSTGYALYVNGSFQSNSSDTTSILNNSGFINFGAIGGAPSYFNGTIDDIEIYDRAFTSDEINQSYRRDFPLFGLNSSVFGSNTTLAFQVEPIQSDGTVGQAVNSSVFTTTSAPVTVPPFWYSNNTNSTVIRKDDFVRFNATWNASAGLTLNSSLFSINQTGQWVNMSWQDLQGISNVSSNVTQITAVGGTKVQWRFYANDSTAQQNQSGIFEFTVSDTVPVASSVNITPSSPNSTTAAAGVWNFSDLDRDPENGTTWTWFVNGTPGWNASGLVSYWRLDGDGRDVLGRNNATIAGGVVNRSGVIKTALGFDGTTAYMNASNLSNINLNLSGQSFSVSAWFKKDGDKGFNAIVSKQGKNLVGGNWAIFGNSDGSITFQMGQNSVGADSVTIGSIDRGWHHVAGTFNSSNTNGSLYLDGVLSGQFLYTYGGIVVDRSLFIGSDEGDQTARSFNGTIDDVKFFNKTLTLAEVANEYQMMWYGSTEKVGGAAGSPAPDVPLSAWGFDEGSGSRAHDFWGDYNGTIINASYTAGMFGTTALSFDGASSVVQVSSAPRFGLLGNFTIMGWVLRARSEKEGQEFIVGKDTIGSRGFGFQVYNNSLAYERNGAWIIQNGVAALNRSVWYHVAVTFNGSTIVTFVNGSVDRSAASGSIPSSTAEFRIGGRQYATSQNFFNGTLEGIELYNRTFSPDEVNQSYRRGFPLFGLNASAFGSNSSLTFQVEPIQFDGIVGSAVNSSEVSTFSIVGVMPPLWYNNNTNQTLIISNDFVRFNVTWNASSGSALNASRFSINQTGDWVNGTWLPLQGISNVSSNVTRITAGPTAKVQWRFYANDSFANQNQTVIFEFTVADITGPSVLNLTANPARVAQSGTVNITVNVTDDAAVDEVLVQVTRSNGSAFNLTAAVSSMETFYSALHAPGGADPLGNYSSVVISNDTTGNLNRTVSVSFEVLDGRTPAVVNLSPAPGSIVSQGRGVNVSVNVTDNGNLDKVIANLTDPSGLVASVELFNTTSGDIFTGNFTSTSVAGVYVIRVSANDSNGNVNDTIISNFTVTWSCGAFNSSVNLTNALASNGTCVNLTRNNTDFDCGGNAVRGDGSGVAVLAEALLVNVTVRNCVISNFSVGFNGSLINSSLVGISVQKSSSAGLIFGGDGSRIENATFDSAPIGVIFASLSNGTLFNTTVSNASTGILVGGSSDNIIRSVNVVNSSGGLVADPEAGTLTVQSFSTVVSGIAVEANGSVSRLNLTNLTVVGGSTGVLVRSGSSGVVVSGASVNNSPIGFNLSGHALLRSVNVTNASFGITASAQASALLDLAVSNASSAAAVISGPWINLTNATLTFANVSLVVARGAENSSILSLVVANATIGVSLENATNVSLRGVVSDNSTSPLEVRESFMVSINDSVIGPFAVFGNATGSINFTAQLNLTNTTLVASEMAFSNLTVFVNGSRIRPLNVTASITFHSINITDPAVQVRHEGDPGFSACPAGVCSVISYNVSQDLIFNVSGFTTYRLVPRVVQSNLTNSTVNLTLIENSTVINANLSDSIINASIINQSVIRSSNITNSTVQNSTVASSAAFNSSFSNTTVNSSYIGGSAIQDSNVLNGTINASTVSGSSVWNSSVVNSSVMGSNVSQSDLNSSSFTNSTILLSTVRGSQVDNASVGNSTLAATIINGSSVDNSAISGSNVTYSAVNASLVDSVNAVYTNITNSTVINSRLENSTVYGSVLQNVTLNNTLVLNSTLRNSTALGGSLVNNTIENSTIIDSNISESVINASRINGSLVNASFVMSSVIDNSTLVNVSASNATARSVNATHSIIRGSSVNFSFVGNSSMSSSNVTNGTKIVKSTLIRSVVGNSTLVNATLDRGNVTRGVLTAAILNATTMINGSAVFSNATNGSFVSGSNLTDSTLSNGSMIRVRFTNSWAANSSLVNATVAGGAIGDSSVDDSYISGNMAASNLNKSYVDASGFTSSNVTNATILNSVVDYAMVSGAIIENSTVVERTVVNSSLLNGTIYRVDLANVTIINSSLDGVNSSDSTINHSNVSASTINRSIVQSSPVSNVTITRVNLTNVTFTGGVAADSGVVDSMFENVNLSNATSNSTVAANGSIILNSTIVASTVANSTVVNTSLDREILVNALMVDGVQNVSCAGIVRRSVVMTRNLSCSGAGIIVLNDNLTVNCSGFSLLGDGTGTGIDVSQRANVTLYGCGVNGFEIGVLIGGSNEVYMKRLSISNATRGLIVEGSDRVQIVNVTLNGTDSSLTIRDSDGTTINESAAGFPILYENTQFGTMNFTGRLNFSSVINFTVGRAQVGNRSAFVNSTRDPRLNVSANIRFIDVDLTAPRVIMRASEGDAGIDCPSSVCGGKLFDGGVLSFNVTHFTTYGLVDAAVNSTIANSSVNDSNVEDSTIGNGSVVDDSNVNRSVLQDSDAINSSIDDSILVNSSFGNGTLDNSTLLDAFFNLSAVYNSTIVNSTLQNVTLNGSVFMGSTGDNSSIALAIVNASRLNNSVLRGSNVTDASVVEGSFLELVWVKNATVRFSTFNASSVEDSAADNSTLERSSVNRSRILASNLTNSSVYASFIDPSIIDNSTITASNLTDVFFNRTVADTVSAVNASSLGSVLNESVLDNMTVVASFVFRSSVNQSFIDNVSLVNSTVLQSAVNRSIAQNSSVNLSNVTSSTINRSSVTVSGVVNTSLAGGAVNMSPVDNSTVINSTLFSSILNRTSANASRIVNASSVSSVIDGARIINSTVSNSSLAESVVNDSFLVDMSSLRSNLTRSILNSSLIERSSLINSTALNKSVVNLSIVDNSTVLVNSSIIASFLNLTIVENSTVSNSSLIGSVVNGSMVYNSTFVASNATGSVVNSSSVFDSWLTNSTAVAVALNGSVVDNVSLKNGTVISSILNRTVSENATFVRVNGSRGLFNASGLGTSVFTNSSAASSSITNTTIDNATLVNATAVGAVVNLSTVQNASIINSSAYRSFANNSVVSGSVIGNSTATNSTIGNSTVGNASIVSSVVLNSSVRNATSYNSTVVNVTLNLSWVSDASVHDSVIWRSQARNGSVINGSGISNSLIGNSTILNSTVINSTIINDLIDRLIIVNNLQFPVCGQNISRNSGLGGNLQANGSGCLAFGGDRLVLNCSGFTILGNGTGTGLDLTGHHGNAVRSCNFANLSVGMNLTRGENNTVSNSRVSGPGVAVLVGQGTKNNIITNMSFSGVSASVLLRDSLNVTFNATFIQPRILVERSGVVSVNFSASINASVSNYTFEGTLNITNREVRLNATLNPLLNTTAILRFENQPFGNPIAATDVNDSGLFRECPTSLCSPAGRTASAFAFQAAHFTGYTILEGPVTSGGNQPALSYQGAVAGGGGGGASARPEPSLGPPPLDVPIPVTRPSPPASRLPAVATPERTAQRVSVGALALANLTDEILPIIEAPGLSRSPSAGAGSIVKPRRLAELAWMILLSVVVVGLGAYIVSRGLFKGGMPPGSAFWDADASPPTALKARAQEAVDRAAEAPVGWIHAFLDFIIDLPSFLFRMALWTRVFVVYSSYAGFRQVARTFGWLIDLIGFIFRRAASALSRTAQGIQAAVFGVNRAVIAAWGWLSPVQRARSFIDRYQHWDLRRRVKGLRAQMKVLDGGIAEQINILGWGKGKEQRVPLPPAPAPVVAARVVVEARKAPVSAARRILSVSESLVAAWGWFSAGLDKVLAVFNGFARRLFTPAWSASVAVAGRVAAGFKKARVEWRKRQAARLNERIREASGQRGSGPSVSSSAPVPLFGKAMAWFLGEISSLKILASPIIGITKGLAQAFSRVAGLLSGVLRVMIDSAMGFVAKASIRANELRKRRTARSIEKIDRKIERQRGGSR